MARLAIEVIAAPGAVAPAGVWLEAGDLVGFDVTPRRTGDAYDPAFHEITYVWILRGAPLAAHDAPQNMVSGWRDANRAYGKQVAFVLPKPGTYTVDLTATDRRGTAATATAEITIADPATAYPGTATVCISTDPDEDWAGAPSGSQRATTSSEIQRLIDAADGPLRLLFKRGQDVTGLAFGINRGRLDHVGAWGEGPRPVLTARDGRPMFRFGKRAAMTGVTFADLDFRGEWDSTTETGIPTSSPFVWTPRRQPGHYTIWNCDIGGFGWVNVQARDTPSTVILGNCRVTNWQNYGLLMRSANAKFALVGMQIAQHPDALHGGAKGGVPSNNHGPLRVSDCAKVYIGASDFFSRTGWSGLTSERADQPCLRINTNARRGMAVNLDRIVCEGGFRVISITGVHGGRTEHPGNYLIDKALLIGTAKTIGPFIAADLGGLTVRNTIGVLPDAPRRHPNNWQGAVRFGSDKPGEGNLTTPMAVYSSTFMNLLESQNDPGWDWRLAKGTEVFANLTEENNVAFPSEDGQKTALDLGQPLPGIRPRYRGVRYNFEPQTGRLETAVPPGGRFFLPYGAITEATLPKMEAPGTDQAYWQATAQTDTAHLLRVGKALYTAAGGNIAVAFEPDGVHILNTGRDTWPAGADWALRLDRLSRLPPMDTRYASPSDPLPVPRPAGGAVRGAVHGLSAADDFFGRPRPEPSSRGAVEPT